MNIIRLTFANLKRYIKTTHLISRLLFMPLVLVVLVTLFTGSSTSMYSSDILLVCNSNGKYESELIKELKIDDKNVFSYDKESDAIDKLKNNNTPAVFVLDKDFSSNIYNTIKPSVKVYKTQEGGGSIWSESLIEKFINDKLKESLDPSINSKLVTATIVENNKILDADSLIAILLICYCLYGNSGILCKDFLDLRSNNVLTRMISTKNKNIEIVFSIFLALFLLQALSCFVVMIILKFIFSININFNMFLIVIANSFASTGVVIAFTRLFKNETSITMASMLYSIGIMFLGMTSILGSLSSNLGFLNSLSKLSPIYWTLEAFNSSNVGFSLILIILIGLVFVTAGSFKLKEFAKN
jgi:ABC-2 type transport system permease protein